MAGKDHSPGGELKTLVTKAALLLDGIQPGEEREVTYEPGDLYVHVPTPSKPEGEGVDAVKITFRRPD